MNFKQYSITVAETLLSTSICAIGVALFVAVGLGSGTIDVLADGLHRTLGITLGLADQIFAIDFVNMMILPLPLASQPFLIRLFLILFAQLCFGMSYAIFQTVKKGMNTVDAVLYFFTEHFSISYVVMRTSLDILFFITGFLLGGSIGIGIVLSTCLMGVTTRYLHHGVVRFKNNCESYQALFSKEETG